MSGSSKPSSDASTPASGLLLLLPPQAASSTLESNTTRYPVRFPRLIGAVRTAAARRSKRQTDRALARRVVSVPVRADRERAHVHGALVVLPGAHAQLDVERERGGLEKLEAAGSEQAEARLASLDRRVPVRLEAEPAGTDPAVGPELRR